MTKLLISALLATTACTTDVTHDEDACGPQPVRPGGFAIAFQGTSVVMPREDYSKLTWYMFELENYLECRTGESPLTTSIGAGQ